ncbi:hypothetical protein HBI54_182900 [Parastagonospora nodorum]|nr:hypothetical protein HBI54_182900 [Parastagonospora nodorum]
MFVLQKQSDDHVDGGSRPNMNTNLYPGKLAGAEGLCSTFSGKQCATSPLGQIHMSRRSGCQAVAPRHGREMANSAEH